MSKSIKRTPVGNNIRDLRKKHNMTQGVISEILGIKRTTFARYETDTIPPVNILTKLGDIFGVTTDELLRSSGDYTTKIQEGPSTGTRFSNYSGYNSENENYAQLTDEEIAMIMQFRSLSPELQEAILKILN